MQMEVLMDQRLYLMACMMLSLNLDGEKNLKNTYSTLLMLLHMEDNIKLEVEAEIHSQMDVLVVSL